MAMQSTGSLLGAAIQIGTNRHRVEHGLPPLARAHLPFNRRERSVDLDQIGRVADAARAAGLSPDRVAAVRTLLYQSGRRPDANGEDFFLTFNAARRAAKRRIYDHARTPKRACWDVYGEICAAIARGSGEARISRADLARECDLTEPEVSRHTTELERLELLERKVDGRGVRYIVTPPEEGFPTWNGDRAARLDAMERNRQPELI